MKLGKLAPRFDARVPPLAKRVTLVQPKESVDWSAKVAAWPMLANDELGDCTAAAAYHLLQCWRANAWRDAWQPSDAQATTLYSLTGGYIPGNPATDRGAVEADVLGHWASQGIPANGELDVCAFASIDPLNTVEFKLACEWFGGVYLGLALPEACMDLSRPWNYGAGMPLAGGHAVCAVGYDMTGATLVTWGQTVRASWAFLLAYMDEAYAVVSRAWLDTTGTAPPGLSWDALQADMASLGA